MRTGNKIVISGRCRFLMMSKIMWTDRRRTSQKTGRRLILFHNILWFRLTIITWTWSLSIQVFLLSINRLRFECGSNMRSTAMRGSPPDHVDRQWGTLCRSLSIIKYLWPLLPLFSPPPTVTYESIEN